MTQYVFPPPSEAATSLLGPSEAATSMLNDSVSPAMDNTYSASLGKSFLGSPPSGGQSVCYWNVHCHSFPLFVYPCPLGNRCKAPTHQRCRKMGTPPTPCP